MRVILPQELRKAFTLMASLCSLGHPSFLSNDDGIQPCRSLRVSELPVDGISVSSLERTVDLWKQRLASVSTEHPYLLFFSSKEAQFLHELLNMSRDGAQRPDAMFELGLSLSPLYQRNSASFDSLIVAIEVAQAEVSAEEPVGRDWPSTVGFFLAAVQRSMQDPPLPLRPSSAAATHWGGLHIHTVEPCSEALLLLVVRIYQRLPEPFEFLWCSDVTSPRSLEMFLERVTQYPGRCFTLLQVECLSATAQQSLLRHMLASRDTTRTQNLHCAQTKPTILQAAPWISQHKDSHSELHRAQAASQLKDWAVGGSDIHSVTNAIGAAGSGKTHWAKKLLAEWKHANVATCVFSITETFSVGEVARKLHSTVSEHRTQRLGLFFHMNLGRFRLTELHEWKSLMERINRFFFSLLVR